MSPTPPPPTDSCDESPRQGTTTNLALPDRTNGADIRSSSSSFGPSLRRPAFLRGEDARRPSVQFLSEVKTDGASSRPTSRSSSAQPSGSARTLGLGPPGPTRRLSSPPPPAQFRPSVSFDTFSNKEASNFSLTLNRKHRDYEYTKRSRTFLCGTDTNDYSDTALEWLIDELVDDGDEVVCLRVVEKDSREAVKWAAGMGEKGYRREAARFLEAIEKKNGDDRAISLVLEFAIGKVHDTIQQMIRIYEPALLVVGTRGRSLTGYQGLLSSGSVSKYCLQYSPVPVVVVRPSSKREAKKRKRLQDPSRTGYRDILDKSEDAPRGRGGHLLDAQNRSGSDLGALGELGNTHDPDHEARMVAEAIGYTDGSGGGVARPPSRDKRDPSLSRVVSGQSDASTNTNTTSDVRSPSGGRLLRSPDPQNLDSPPLPSDEEEGEEGEELDEEDDRVAQGGVPIRPEDEAAMLAYERAQKIFEEEREEEEERARRERQRAERSASRGGAGSRSASRRRMDEGEDEGRGAAALGLLAQLDRGLK